MNVEKIQIFIKRFFIVLLVIAILSIGVAITVFCYVHFSYDENVLDLHKIAKVENIDYIVVLGCGLKKDGSPNNMLHDRVEQAVNVYNIVKAPLILSGDSASSNHDEVGAMKKLAIEFGVKEDDIILDGFGLSTYDSIWRVKNLYNAKRIVIVTQEYHLYRAIYIGEELGMESYGISASLRKYNMQLIHDLREMLACDKEFFNLKIFSQQPIKEEYISN